LGDNFSDTGGSILGGCSHGTLFMNGDRPQRHFVPAYRGICVLHAYQVSTVAQLPYTAFRDGILAHPTMAEGLNLLFSNVLGRN
ncbi:MAG: hypothetical protein QOD93_6159, partial [Acetobacteraceae bacterium]|nr:hypothetical protein [Acetobacteraceae bacterium]